MGPLPDPDTVAIQPTRLLLERASKMGCTLKFHSIAQEDHTFDVHAFIDLYLLARYASVSLSMLHQHIYEDAGRKTVLRERALLRVRVLYNSSLSLICMQCCWSGQHQSWEVDGCKGSAGTLVFRI